MKMHGLQGIRRLLIARPCSGRHVRPFVSLSFHGNFGLKPLVCRFVLLGCVIVAANLPASAGVLQRANSAYLMQPEPIIWIAGGDRSGGAAKSSGVQQKPQPHLGQWLRLHKNMTLEQQEKALRDEPGFSRLPVPQQQRLMNRLQQLDAMPPQQRERTLQRMEALEKLSPEQRQQLHSAMQDVARLPEQRQRMMHKAFQDLSQLPSEQRQAILESSQFKGQFSDSERQILSTLMSVQPYLPQQRQGVEYGGK